METQWRMKIKLKWQFCIECEKTCILKVPERGNAGVYKCSVAGTLMQQCPVCSEFISLPSWRLMECSVDKAFVMEDKSPSLISRTHRKKKSLLMWWWASNLSTGDVDTGRALGSLTVQSILSGDLQANVETCVGGGRWRLWGWHPNLVLKPLHARTHTHVYIPTHMHFSRSWRDGSAV